MAGRPSKASLAKKELLQEIEYREKLVHKKKLEIIKGLPHLYERKWYAWARQFFESKNKVNLLCAANQSTKSSTQIRKCIHWATHRKLWPELWPGRTPRVFWYLYPSGDVATIEFEKKWEPEFMPRDSYKTSKMNNDYGWTTEYDKKQIKAVHFNSGVTIYFKSYTQDASNLQTGSVDAIFADEELPEELYPELVARLFSTKGYFHMVFTATLNQEMWYRAIEGKPEEQTFPNAFKLQVTQYDCMSYEDGSPGQFTEEDIQNNIAACRNKTEIDRRILGRFVMEAEGRKYGAFDPSRHYVKPFPIPPSWKLYAGVDVGSGGLTAHPGAICFVAVRPDYRYGVVFKAWRGDGITTTAGDIVQKFIDMRGDLKFTLQVYDQQSKDFFTIASRMGESFVKAEKSHEIGEEFINTLFKNDMLQLFDGDDEIRKLGIELTLLLKSTPKQKAHDDLSDSGRYSLTQIPWDWTYIKKGESGETPSDSTPLTAAQILELQMKDRRGEVNRKKTDNNWDETQAEFDFWNAEYGS